MIELPKLKVVGVAHCVKDSKYQNVLNYVHKFIRPDQVVSLEFPGTLQEILNEKEPTDTTAFWYAAAKILLHKGNKVETADDVELNKKHNELHNLILKIVEKDKLKECPFRELLDLEEEITMVRTATIYNKSVENNSNILITGYVHAYDIEKWKKKEVRVKYISEPSLQDMVARDKVIEKYLKGEINREQLLAYDLSLIEERVNNQ